MCMLGEIEILRQGLTYIGVADPGYARLGYAKSCRITLNDFKNTSCYISYVWGCMWVTSLILGLTSIIDRCGMTNIYDTITTSRHL